VAHRDGCTQLKLAIWLGAPESWRGSCVSEAAPGSIADEHIRVRAFAVIHAILLAARPQVSFFLDHRLISILAVTFMDVLSQSRRSSFDGMTTRIISVPSYFRDLGPSASVDRTEVDPQSVAEKRNNPEVRARFLEEP
jgi:hypothetical protein